MPGNLCKLVGDYGKLLGDYEKLLGDYGKLEATAVVVSAVVACIIRVTAYR